MRYIHTCYRVLDLDRSIDFYTNKLGLELARKVPVGDDATNAFLAVPGDSEPRSELTLNHGREENPTLWAKATATSPSPSRISTPSPRGSRRPVAWTSRASRTP